MKIAKINFLLMTMFLVSSLIWADVPQIINYQGRLLDSSGETIPDGNYEISFSIYDALTGGQLKWSETQVDVNVTDGFFNAVIGEVVALSDTVFNGAERYLEISIGGQSISPRTHFTSSGYAYRIGTIDGARAGQLSGSLILSPSEFIEPGNAITVLDANSSPVFDVSVDASGFSTVSFYEPADAKDASFADLSKSLDISINPSGAASINFYEPADSKNGLLAIPSKAMEISVDALGLGSINFYEPADSKSGNFESSRKVEMHKGGLIMFGATDQDTSLIVAPNGDIIGLGQITMGENSSDGVHTSVLGFDNDASGDSSAIGGGSFNVTTGAVSVIGGGHANNTSGTGATISGGAFNDASGEYAAIGGGLNNVAMGNYATIPGGLDNDANGIHSYAAGHRATAEHNGTFVWADQTDADFVSTGDDQFIIRAGGGVGIGTNSPLGALDVVGNPGDGSVNLPDDAISSPEVFDEPGIAANRNASEITLPQGALTVQDLITAAITIPSDGYIMITGGATFESSGTSKENQVFVQIDETPGGGLDSPHFSIVGAGDHDTPSSIHYFSINSQRIYYKTAGTYEFRLEGQANPDNGSSAVSRILNPYLTTVYFPTAYGPVTTSSSPAIR